MASASIASEVGKALDIHGHFTSPVTFDHIAGFDDLSDLGDFIRTEVVTVHLIGKVRLIKYFPGRGQSYAVNIRQGPVQMLVFR
jgi:hypothetical protein